MEAVAHASVGDDVQTWRALDRAEAAVERVAAEEPPPWSWVFPFDARKIATHRLTCAVRLRRPDVAAAVDLAATTRSERVWSQARQFRRTIPAPAPPGLLRDFDEHLRAATTREQVMG